MKQNRLTNKNIPNLIVSAILFTGFFITLALPAIGDTDPANDYNFQLEELLVKIEEKYSKHGFKADFKQESTLKAIGLTETASGKVYLKKPGKMRWEYEEPEKQLYISNGKVLWAYSPGDKSVMIGEQSSNFDFLTDMQQLKTKYDISIVNKDHDNLLKIELMSKIKDADFSKVHLTIAEESSIIKEIISYNVNQDETIIYFSNHQFDKTLDESLFNFEIPAGTDILRYD